MEDGNEIAAAGRRRVARQVEQVATIEARIAELHAAQVSVLADLQVDPYVDDHAIDLVDELAPRLRWTAFTAARRLDTAARVACCFPLLLDELTGGEIDYRRIDVVVREAELLDEEQALVLDAVLAGRLPGLTTTQIQDLVRREIALIDCEAVKERARRVVAGRRVGFTALADGEALLQLLGPASSLRAAYDRLDALAKDTSRPGAGVDPYAGHPGVQGTCVQGASRTDARDDGARHTGTRGTDARGTEARGIDARGTDARGIDAKRFDAGVEMLLAPVPGAPGVATGTGPQITVAWSAATGLDDGPAHLAGHGAIPAELVRHLLRSQGFRCVATDPATGHVVAADGHAHPAGSLPHRDDLLSAAARLRDESPAERRVGPQTVVAAPHAAALRTSTTTHTTRTSGDRDGDGDGGGAAASSRPFADAGTPTRSDLDEPTAPGPDWWEDHRDTAGRDDPDDSAAWNELDDAPGWDAVNDPAGAGRPAAWGDDEGRRDLERLCFSDEGSAEGPDEFDPALGPQQDEFAVTLDISALRPATLVNPLQVFDVEEWRRRASRRARSAVARCPAAAGPVRAYRFPAAVRRLLLARSPTCAAPGCCAPAHRCDLDHTVEFAGGGPTCPCNAGPLCRRHHTARHERGWFVTRTHGDPRDPTLTWLSPLGYLYTTSPHPLLAPVSRVVVEHLTQRRRSRAALRRKIARRPVMTCSITGPADATTGPTDATTGTARPALSLPTTAPHVPDPDLGDPPC